MIDELTKAFGGAETAFNTSKSLLEAVDQQLARFEEKTQLGVFQNATPYPLLVSQLPEVQEERPAPTGSGPSPAGSARPATCIGLELARHALASPSPRLIVSDVGPEQEAAHLLCRGVFGFVRNSVHHRIVATLQPERVLQIVGMVDYLIWVAETARRESRGVPGPMV